MGDVGADLTPGLERGPVRLVENGPAVAPDDVAAFGEEIEVAPDGRRRDADLLGQSHDGAGSFPAEFLKDQRATLGCYHPNCQRPQPAGRRPPILAIRRNATTQITVIDCGI